MLVDATILILTMQINDEMGPNSGH